MDRQGMHVAFITSPPLNPFPFQKVVLIQLAVPSRQDVEEYQNLRSTVNELVGRINGRFGTVEFMPIHFMHKSLNFDELCALYAVSDVCLVSSTRDGMNLVCSKRGRFNLGHCGLTQPFFFFFRCRTNMLPASKRVKA